MSTPSQVSSRAVRFVHSQKTEAAEGLRNISKKEKKRAKRLVSDIKRKRRELRPLVNKLRRGVRLSEEEKFLAVSLVSEIGVAKTATTGLGFNLRKQLKPKIPTLSKKAKRKKRRGSGLRIRGRQGGAGLYGLGRSMKVWKNTMLGEGTEAQTRTNRILPMLQAAGWGAVQDSRIHEEINCPGGIMSGGKKGKGPGGEFVLTYSGRKLAMQEATELL